MGGCGVDAMIDECFRGWCLGWFGCGWGRGEGMWGYGLREYVVILWDIVVRGVL